MPEAAVHRRALLALIVAVALGSVGAVCAFPGRQAADGKEGLFLMVLGASVLVSCRPVRLSRLKVDVVPFHPLVLLALGLFGIRSAVIIAVVSIITAASLRNELPPAMRVLFNLGATTLATVAAGHVLLLLGGEPGGTASDLLVPLTAGSLMFFVVKTGLVASAISLEIGQRYLATWKRSLRWTAISDLAGIPVALAALAVAGTSSLAALAVALVPCWLLWLHYKLEASRRGSAGGPTTSASAAPQPG
jgi:hypothetical protein